MCVYVCVCVCVCEGYKDKRTHNIHHPLCSYPSGLDHISQPLPVSAIKAPQTIEA